MKDPVLQKLSLEEWKRIAELAHLTLFNESGYADLATVSYALVCGNSDVFYTYATIIEMDAQTAHMQHGGAMPNVAGTVSVVKAYRMTLSYLREHYKRITTRIHHKNLPMLKMALHEGLLITGCDCHKDGVYLCLSWGFE